MTVLAKMKVVGGRLCLAVSFIMSKRESRNKDLRGSRNKIVQGLILLELYPCQALESEI